MTLLERAALGVLDGYVRNSTLDQVNNLRADHQRRVLPELAGKHGFGCDLHEEQGVSGESLDNRPTLQAILGRVRRKERKGLVAVAFDRLSRDEDVLDGLLIWQTCARAGAVLITPEQAWYPGRDHADLLVAFVKFWQAAAYKKDTLKNLFEGLVERARLASMFRGNIPGGYVRVPASYTTNGGKRIKATDLDVDEPSIPAIQRVFREWPLKSNRAIATGLNRDGITRRRWDDRAGPDGTGGIVETLWRADSVGRMVRYPIYCGLTSWGVKATERVSGLLGADVPRFERPDLAIVGYAAWKVCQGPKPGRPARRGEVRGAEHRGLSGGVFKGLLVCPGCGGPMYGGIRHMGKPPNKTRAHCYQCAAYHFHGRGPGGCDTQTRVLEHAIIEAVRPRLLELLPLLDLPGLVEGAAREREAQGERRAALEAEVAGLMEQRSELLERALLRELFTEAELTDKARALARRLGEKEAELRSLDQTPGAVGPLAHLAGVLGTGRTQEVLGRAGRDEWRLLVRTVFARLEIAWDRPGTGGHIKVRVRRAELAAAAGAWVSKQGRPR